MEELPLFPILTVPYILEFQFSSWYPIFTSQTIKSTIIKPLSPEFREYLNADGVFVPEGSEDPLPATSTLSDDDGGDEEEEEEEDTPRKHYAFPDLDKQIRQAIHEYGGVFPKLNFSSPKDASWVLHSSSRLKCSRPADVYIVLKSSDFVTHDLSAESVFEGCQGGAPSSSSTSTSGYDLELVLRKWYPVDRAREVRCFVRDGMLIGISQRDTNYYEFWNDPDTQLKVVAAVHKFWETHIKPRWEGSKDYIFDFLLTRDLSRGHILDFNPYAPKTDPLLFTYEELRKIRMSRSCARNDLDSTPASKAELRVIDSPFHPTASRNAPAYQHNMVPFEAISLSSGHDIEQFADLWKESVKQSMREPE